MLKHYCENDMYGKFHDFLYINIYLEDRRSQRQIHPKIERMKKKRRTVRNSIISVHKTCPKEISVQSSVL